MPDLNPLTQGYKRRDVLALLGIGAICIAAGCGSSTPAVSPIPPAHPGAAQKAFHAPGTRRIALTIDDGFDVETVDAYVSLSEQTGFPLTFNPIGILAQTWEGFAPRLRPLIADGRVQIANHTFHHRVLTSQSDTDVRTEIESNEEWIDKTFRVTSRPYLRPPDGLHDARVDDIAGALGFTKVLLWQGSLGDSAPVSQAQLMQAAQDCLHPGAVVLGHANYPTVRSLLPEIVDLIGQRKLEPSTLDEMFGTSRDVG